MEAWVFEIIGIDRRRFRSLHLTLTTVDGTTMKMLVDRIHIRNDGIVVEFKCGVAIEQKYVK